MFINTKLCEIEMWNSREQSEKERKKEREREKELMCTFIRSKNCETQKQTYGIDLDADYRNVSTLILLAFDLLLQGYELMRIGLCTSGTSKIVKEKSDGWLWKRIFDRKQEYLRRKYYRSGRTIPQRQVHHCRQWIHRMRDCRVCG